MINILVLVHVSVVMNFSFKKAAPKRAAVKAFDEDSDKEESLDNSKPIDYVYLRGEMEKNRNFGEEVNEEIDQHKEREALVRRREDTLAGGLNYDKRTTSSSAVDTSQAGLVIIREPATERGEAKHISRMVETAQVNEKFKNLLRIKIAEREKDKAESEFGVRPEEIVTKAYLKQKEESLRLERELEASESKKKDLSNMFREMLESGSYARSKFVDIAAQEHKVEESLLSRITAKEEQHEVSEAMVKKVLEKIVPESSKEVTRAVEEQARQEAFKIVEQLDKLEGAQDNEDREEARISAKERYLERKKQRLAEQD
jgi:hypothetical protein